MRNIVFLVLGLMALLGILGCVGGVLRIFSNSQPINKVLNHKIGILRLFHALSTILISIFSLLLYLNDMVGDWTAFFIFGVVAAPIFFIEFVMEKKLEVKYSSV